MKKDKLALVTIAMAATLSLAACGGGTAPTAGVEHAKPGEVVNEDGAAPGLYGIQVDSEAASLLPEEYRNGIIVAADPQYPPADFLDEAGNEIGYAVDLAAAIGASLGVKVQFEQTGFDGIIPGMHANRYHFSLFNDTDERRKTLDFVDLTSSGSSLLTLDGNPSNLDVSSLCGKTVAAAKGSAQATVVPEQLSSDCLANGEQEVTVLTFPGANDAVLAVKSGRVEGAIVDTFLAGYVDKQEQGLEKVGAAVGEGLWGIGLSKDSPLVKPFAAALQSLMNSGAYMKILAEWGVQDVALTKTLVNGEPAE